MYAGVDPVTKKRHDLVEVIPPGPQEVSDSVVRAQRSLAEVAARYQADQRAEADERAAQLARWHDEDQTVEQDEAVDEPVLELDVSEPSG